MSGNGQGEGECNEDFAPTSSPLTLACRAHLRLSRASLMDYFVESGKRLKRGPRWLADERAKTCVMSGVEVFDRGPLSNVHEPEASIRSKRSMEFVPKISALAAHVRVYLLPQREEFVLTSAGDFKTIDQYY
jgi:hypothetical protein